MAEFLAEHAGTDDGAEAAATIAVTFGPTFRERDREQREDVLTLLATLADVFDIRLPISRVSRAWLQNVHRQDLPGVSEWADTPTHGGPLDDIVDAALAELDPDGRAIRLLEHLVREPGESLSYGALYAQMTVSDARVRQLIGELSELDLVETFGAQTDRYVELLVAGRVVLDALESEFGRQQTLSESVSGIGKSDPQAVLPEQARGDPPCSDDSAANCPAYRDRYGDRTLQAAAPAAATNGGISLLTTPTTGGESLIEGRTKYHDFNPSTNEAVVSVRATGGFHYVVSIATALASPTLLEDALSGERLDAIDDPPAILRDARCIGALSEEALDDPLALRKGLVDWGNEIEDLTTQMQQGDYDDRTRFRREIMRSAHGLAGSIIHLLDIVGVDVIRDVRVPSGLTEDQLRDLAKSVAITCAIQSRYGAFASYRQLFDTVAGEPQLTPTVDAENPVANLIGGFVLRGSDAHRLREPLEERLTDPGQLHEDASEFIVRVPIREPGRREFGEAIGRILSRKNLRPSRETVSLLYAFAPSPFTACRAVMKTLATEPTPDDLRIDEVRTALATLEPEELLPDLPPSVGKIVAALLQTDRRLSRSDLTKAADVSTRTLRNHRDKLASLGLIDISSNGWRLTLSFATTDERREPVIPSAVVQTFVEATDSLLMVDLPPDRYGNPDDPVARSVFWPPDPWGLVDSNRYISPWVALAARLSGAGRSDTETDIVVEMGPAIEQVPILDPTPTGEIIESVGRKPTL
jgi:DNA-binding transcriptional ArsR family regulator